MPSSRERFMTIEAAPAVRICAKLSVARSRPRRLAGAPVGLALALLLSSPSVAQQRDVLVVRNARIFPVTGAVIPNGSLLVENGKIIAVGTDVSVPAGARVIDVRGKSVMPGIVESHSHMGMKRLWTPADLDNNELSGAINAQTRAIDSIDTTDPAFPIALAAGITTMNITNGSQTPNGGQPAVLKLRGGTVDNMYIAPGGMKFALRTTFRERNIYPTTHMGVVSILRENLIAAQEYVARRRAYEAGGKSGPAPTRDLKLEALGKVVTREFVVGVHAQTPLEILDALRIAKEFNLDLFIHHGTSLVDVVEDVAAAGVPVSFGPVLPGMGAESRLLQGPVRLAQLGGKVAFHQDHPDGPQYYLRHIGAMCVRQGMPESEALKALTINPASLFHLDRRIGSLEVGKDADFIILSGSDPLDYDSLVEQVFIDGKEMFNRATGRTVFGPVSPSSTEQ
jgi:imidazolonepropionase-like amidohydrolase